MNPNPNYTFQSRLNKTERIIKAGAVHRNIERRCRLFLQVRVLLLSG